MKNKLTIILVALLSGMAMYAQETDLRQQFEQELVSKNANVTSIKCCFTQTREAAVLAKAVNKEGIFYFQQPGNMLLAFNDGDFIKMTETWFEIKTAGSVTTTKVSSNPMLRQLSSILSACVAGDFEQMAKGFAISIELEQDEWIVVLTPQRGKGAIKISRIVICFDRKDMSLNTLKMEEKPGDYTMYRFTDKQFNVHIDSQLFNITE